MGFDLLGPTSARILNYLQDGKDSYEVDEELARGMLSVAPNTKAMVWFSRQFLVGSVRLAAEEGVRQFLDVGAGLPISPSVHETAQAIHPDARVVYVDYDPVVVAHWNAMSSGARGVAALLGDVRRPSDILDQLTDCSLLDRREPVAALLVGVLPFVRDEDDPAGIVARIRDWMAPGSYIAVTQTSSTSDPELVQRLVAAAELTPSEIVLREAAQVATFVDGFELLEPGIAPIQQWLAPDLPETELVTHGVIGRKPGGISSRANAAGAEQAG